MTKYVFVQRHYLASSEMFTHIRFGSSKNVLPRGLENDLAYSSNLVDAWRLSIYTVCVRSFAERVSKKVSVEEEWFREKVREWAESLLDFVSVDKCWIYFAPVFWSFVLWR